MGFGGKFGVQADRQDKSAVGWDHVEQVSRHHSQTDHSKVKIIFISTIILYEKIIFLTLNFLSYLTCYLIYGVNIIYWI